MNRDKVEAQAIFQDDSDHSKGGSSQRIRIFAASWRLTNLPEADQKVELVGERHRDRDRVGRHPVRGADRLVVILDRLSDRRVLPLRERVVLPHQPLQLGELADHLGDKVGLGELRRPLGLVGIGADQRRYLAGELGDARDALALRAELVVEDDAGRGELRHALVERLRQVEPEFFRRRAHRRRVVVRQGAPVGLVEVARVRQAGADDAAVAGDDRLAAVARLEVRHHDEAGGEARRRFTSPRWGEVGSSRVGGSILVRGLDPRP